MHILVASHASPSSRAGAIADEGNEWAGAEAEHAETTLAGLGEYVARPMDLRLSMVLSHVMVSGCELGRVTGFAMRNQWVVGLAVLLVAFGTVVAFGVWEEWGNVALGV